jgi:hypothetical protein
MGVGIYRESIANRLKPCAAKSDKMGGSALKAYSTLTAEGRNDSAPIAANF